MSFHSARTHKNLSEIRNIGCLESLVHYKRLLLKIYAKVASQSAEVESKRLMSECQSILDKLLQVDPYRRKRYEELRAHVVLSD